MAARVTVVVPGHNAESSLAAALESVLAQLYSDWEVVIVDDASEDATFEVAQSFARRFPGRIRTTRLKTNQGPAAARNAAIAASSCTELLALLDADDVWLPEYLTEQVALYDRVRAEGTRVGVVCCNAYIETPDGQQVGTLDELQGWVDPVTYEDMIERSYVFVSALFPRKAIERVGVFATTCWGSEDYDLWLRIMEAGYEVVPNREPLVVYRISATGVSSSQLRMAEAGLAAYARALERGAATPAQERAIKRRIRHYNALRFREMTLEALAQHRRLDALRFAIRGFPTGLVAVLQAPARWGEWARELGSFERRSA